jgi:hypothetical protein
MQLPRLLDPDPTGSGRSVLGSGGSGLRFLITNHDRQSHGLGGGR